MVQVQLFLLLIFFNVCFSDDVCETGEGNDIVCAVISSIQNFIEHGKPEIGIPPLDPLAISEVPLNFTSESFKGHLQLNNLYLTGLLFTVTEAKLELITSTAIIGLKFPSIVLQAAYNGDLKIMNMIHLYGNGDLQISMTDLSLNVELKVKVITQKLSNVKVILNSPAPIVKTVITGLFDDPFMSSIISRQLSNTVTTLLEEQYDALNNLLKYLVDEYINSNLEKLFKK